VALEPVAGRKMRFATIPFGMIHASTGLALCPEASVLRGLQQRPSPRLRALAGWARRLPLSSTTASRSACWLSHSWARGEWRVGR
jgi:hypothetical protein